MRSQRGAVLISALAMVAVMSGVALTALGSISASLRDTVRRQDSEQARLHAVGATHWAVLHLTDAGTAILNKEHSIAIANIRAIAVVRDGANCFNLNALLADPGTPTRRRAERIFSALAGDPDHRSAVIVDLRESRVGLGLFADLADVAATEGLERDTFDALSLHICLRPDTGLRPLNLNTLETDQIALLEAYTGHSDSRAASGLLRSRPTGGFAVLEEALSDPFFADGVDSSLIAIQSSIRDIAVSVRYHDASAMLSTTVERRGGTMRQLSQKLVW